MPIIFQVSERLKKLNLQHVLSRTDLPTHLPPLSSNEASECEKNENTFKELCEMISFRENSRHRKIYDVMASQFSLAIQNIPPVLMEQYQETGFLMKSFNISLEVSSKIKYLHNIHLFLRILLNWWKQLHSYYHVS